MSSGLEHRECAESLGAYVLGALPEAESLQVQRHLAECRECRAEFEWLRVATDALPASVAPVDPPPELKARLMQTVQAEAELLRAAGPAADRPPAKRRRFGAPWFPGALGFAGGLAAAAVIALGVVVLSNRGASGARTIQAQITNPALKAARASLIVRGTRAELVVRNLRAPGPNHVDELWVSHGGGNPTPAGTFVVRSGAVAVGRPVRRGDQVLVTVEPGRGSRRPTTPPFLVARV